MHSLSFSFVTPFCLPVHHRPLSLSSIRRRCNSPVHVHVSVPVCKVKASNNDNKNNNKRRRSRPSSSIPDGEQELLEEFEAGAGAGAGSTSTSKRKGRKNVGSNEDMLMKIEALKQAEKEKDEYREQRKKKDVATVPITKALGKAIPKSRDDTIELLVKGAWGGVFILVGLFFAVHLFIVGDWVGRK